MRIIITKIINDELKKNKRLFQDLNESAISKLSELSDDKLISVSESFDVGTLESIFSQAKNGLERCNKDLKAKQDTMDSGNMIILEKTERENEIQEIKKSLKHPLEKIVKFVDEVITEKKENKDFIELKNLSIKALEKKIPSMETEIGQLEQDLALGRTMNIPKSEITEKEVTQISKLNLLKFAKKRLAIRKADADHSVQDISGRGAMWKLIEEDLFPDKYGSWPKDRPFDRYFFSFEELSRVFHNAKDSEKIAKIEKFMDYLSGPNSLVDEDLYIEKIPSLGMGGSKPSGYFIVPRRLLSLEFVLTFEVTIDEHINEISVYDQILKGKYVETEEERKENNKFTKVKLSHDRADADVDASKYLNRVFEKVFHYVVFTSVFKFAEDFEEVFRYPISCTQLNSILSESLKKKINFLYRNYSVDFFKNKLEGYFYKYFEEMEDYFEILSSKNVKYEKKVKEIINNIDSISITMAGKEIKYYYISDKSSKDHREKIMLKIIEVLEGNPPVYFSSHIAKDLASEFKKVLGINPEQKVKELELFTDSIVSEEKARDEEKTIDDEEEDVIPADFNIKDIDNMIKDSKSVEDEPERDKEVPEQVDKADEVDISKKIKTFAQILEEFDDSNMPEVEIRARVIKLFNKYYGDRVKLHPVVYQAKLEALLRAMFSDKAGSKAKPEVKKPAFIDRDKGVGFDSRA